MHEKQEEMITIKKSEYDALQARDSWLGYLEVAGVDNWSGFHDAVEMYHDDKRKNS